jgi:signal transduction histidine kinase/uncharacterized membrane protein affecting hemolysin expression/ActR/RegA family two-component response regulator
MYSFKKASIKSKLVILILFISGACLLAASAVYFSYEMHRFHRDVAKETAVIAGVVGANSTAALAFDDRSSAEETLKALKAEPDVVAAAIYKPDGTLFANYRRESRELTTIFGDRVSTSAEPVRLLLISAEKTKENFIFSSQYLILFRSITLEGERIGDLLLQVDLREIRQRMRNYLTIAAMVLLACLLLAYLLSSRLQRIISGPIQALAETARIVSVEKNYSVRATRQSEDEMGLLIEGFNEMLEQIQQRDSELQRAHDELEERVRLRTLELQEQIRERERAEVALRESLQTSDDIVQAIPSGLLICQYQKSSTFLVIKANPEAQRLTGIEQSTQLVVILDEFWPQMKDENLRKARLRVMETGEIFETEMEFEKTGEVMVFKIHLFRMPGQLLGIAFENVTERKRLESQLRHAQKMESVGQLAGGVAHDFNNLLQAILGHTQLALNHATGNPQLNGGLQQIHRAAERAASLTSQLLAFSRRQVLQPRDVDLNEIISNLMSMLRRLIGEHIDLDVTLGEDLPFARVDPGQFEQVLMNLCVNARDALADGGRITIETTNASLDEDFCRKHPWARTGHYVVFRVSDNGVGMPPEIIDRIFEPFFTTKDIGKGTGLGLATTYGIVKQHNGFIHVYSEVGKGTSFEVYLPEGITPEKPPREGIEYPVETAPSPGGDQTILLAEDEMIVRDLAVQILSGGGYRVLPASNGQEAVQMFEKHHEEIAMVILDVIMPKMSGRGAYDRIRRIRPDTPVLFSSGYDVYAADEGFILGRGMQFIQKPYGARDLLRKVREMLNVAERMV